MPLYAPVPYFIAAARVAPTYYVCDGDSLTANDGASGVVNWFNLLMAQFDMSAAVGKNWAASSKTIAQIVSTYNTAGPASTTASGGHQFSPAVTGGRGIYFIFAGTNDLGGGASAASVYANITTLISNAHTDGYMKVVVFTVPTRTSAGFDAAAEVQRGLLNTAIVANAGGADYIVDVSSIVGPYTDAYQFSDGLHFTTDTQAKIATFVRTKLNNFQFGVKTFANKDAMLSGKADTPGQLQVSVDGNNLTFGKNGANSNTTAFILRGTLFNSDNDQWYLNSSAAIQFQTGADFGIGMGKIFATKPRFTAIPTSSSGLSSGDVYSNAGILTIVP